jgi:hypothetical protein
MFDTSCSVSTWCGGTWQNSACKQRGQRVWDSSYVAFTTLTIY